MIEHREYAALERSVFEFAEDEVTYALVKDLGDKIPENDYEGKWELEFVHPVINDGSYLLRLRWTKHSGFKRNK